MDLASKTGKQGRSAKFSCNHLPELFAVELCQFSTVQTAFDVVLEQLALVHDNSTVQLAVDDENLKTSK